jgi:hypothetical protein
MRGAPGAAARRGDRIMEIICRQCEGNAFRLLPEELGTVTAECVACGSLTVIEIRKLSARSLLAAGPKDHHHQPINGHRRDDLILGLN